MVFLTKQVTMTSDDKNTAKPKVEIYITQQNWAHLCAISLKCQLIHNCAILQKLYYF